MAALLLWSIGPLAVKSSESKPPIQYSTVDSMESSKIQLGQNGLLVVFSSKVQDITAHCCVTII